MHLGQFNNDAERASKLDSQPTPSLPLEPQKNQRYLWLKKPVFLLQERHYLL